jgi:hypothetical protein
VIAFVVPEEGRFGIDAFLAGEGSPIADMLRVITYEALAPMRSLPVGTWIFTALDRLGPAERELARHAARRIDTNGCATVLNRPDRVLLRTELLRAACAAGLNRFNAFPADALRSHDARAAVRYPVFVREANAHNGSLTPLLADEVALDRALLRLRLRGHPRGALLVVEFCNTRDANGVFRKYSAFIVGDRILPRYMNASREWMVKQDTRLYDPALAEEEAAYLDGATHLEWLRRAFALAGVEYGRIDYGVLDSQPQLWEINTNPTIGRTGKPRVRPPEAERYRARIAAGRARFYERFLEAWRALDTDAAGEIPFEPPPSLLRACVRDAERRSRPATLAARLLSLPAGRRLSRALAPAAGRLLGG